MTVESAISFIFIVLFGGSIIFLIKVYGDLLKDKANDQKKIIDLEVKDIEKTVADESLNDLVDEANKRPGNGHDH